MTKKRQDASVAAAAERQMHAWALTQEIAERLMAEGTTTDTNALGPYVAISREAGAGGGEIARCLGRRLRWEVLDKDLVARVAERFKVAHSAIEVIDERKPSWFFDFLSSWLEPRVVHRQRYIVQLGRVINAAARRGRVIFVGRGAQFFLPRDRGLAVRIVAAERYRVRRLGRHLGVDDTEAQRRIEEIDFGRADFVYRYVHQDIASPHIYDLVLHAERFGTEAAAELIADALRVRLDGSLAESLPTG